MATSIIELYDADNHIDFDDIDAIYYALDDLEIHDRLIELRDNDFDLENLSDSIKQAIVTHITPDLFVYAINHWDDPNSLAWDIIQQINYDRLVQLIKKLEPRIDIQPNNEHVYRQYPIELSLAFLEACSENYADDLFGDYDLYNLSSLLESNLSPKQIIRLLEAMPWDQNLPGPHNLGEVLFSMLTSTMPNRLAREWLSTYALETNYPDRQLAIETLHKYNSTELTSFWTTLAIFDSTQVEVSRQALQELNDVRADIAIKCILNHYATLTFKQHIQRRISEKKEQLNFTSNADHRVLLKTEIAEATEIISTFKSMLNPFGHS